VTNSTDELAELLAPFSNLSKQEIVGLLRILRPSKVAFITPYFRAHPEARSALPTAAPQSAIDVALAMQRSGSSTPACPRCPRCQQEVRGWHRLDGIRVCKRCRNDARRGTCTQCGKVRQLHNRHLGQLICRSCYSPSEKQLCTRCGKFNALGKVANGVFTCVGCTPRSVQECVRCGLLKPRAGRMLGGIVCAPCFQFVKNHPASCPQCDVDRVLYLVNELGTPICARCAGVRPRFACDRCGSEEHQWGLLCAGCTLDDSLVDVLGNVGSNQDIETLRGYLRGRSNPATSLQWLKRSPHISLVRDIAHGVVPALHSSFDHLPRTRSLHYVRDLLTICGVLAEEDRRVHDLRLWIDNELRFVSRTHEPVLKSYVLWELLQVIRRKEREKSLRDTHIHAVKSTVRECIAFFDWVEARSIRVSDLVQADIEIYQQERTITASFAKFLHWYAREHAIALRIHPHPKAQPAVAMSESRRLELYETIITDFHAPTSKRLACSLVLVFGLDLFRVVRLSEKNFEIQKDGSVWATFASRAVLLPERMGRLYRAHRSSIAPAQEWLFPGSHFGRSLKSSTLGMWLKSYGTTAPTLKVAARFHLASTVNSPVLRTTIGIGSTAAIRYSVLSGATWSSVPLLYGGKDHSSPEDLIKFAAGATGKADRHSETI